MSNRILNTKRFILKAQKKKKKPEAPMLETTNRCAGTQQWNEENLV